MLLRPCNNEFGKKIDHIVVDDDGFAIFVDEKALQKDDMVFLAREARSRNHFFFSSSLSSKFAIFRIFSVPSLCVLAYQDCLNNFWIR